MNSKGQVKGKLCHVVQIAVNVASKSLQCFPVYELIHSGFYQNIVRFARIVPVWRKAVDA